MAQHTLHPFDLATSLRRQENGIYEGKTDPGYAGFIGPFGGITAATLLKATMEHPERMGDPLALTVNFAQAIADGPFEIEAIPVRTNNSTQHWTVVLTQNNTVAATASAVFAKRRPTWTTTDAQPPQAQPPAEFTKLAGPQLPTWFANYDLRVVQGMPLDDSKPLDEKDSRTVLWVRDEPKRPVDFVALASMCDVFVPRVFVRRPVRVPAGTVSLSTYFHVDAERLSTVGTEHVLGMANASHFGLGYHDQSAQMWSQAGQLLATSHQIVYFKN